MKGRSHRLPVATAPMDDWIDGSWTVDCPCGVTFDDGEEMVKCDECGVWVHTRCTRFVKEEVSFTCDKCKGKTPRSFSLADRGDDSTCGAVGPAATNIEETEVAQLLAELPTKADPCPPPAYQRTTFRRWAELPMEEKVHVQGVPGGDPALFEGLSTIFSQELWKCTGYVPKKFNFKYKEFPCWDHDESENPASTGADLLFSLSKDSVTGVPTEAVERMTSPKGLKSRDGKGLFSGDGHQFAKKERSKFRGLGFHSSKRREDDSTGSKDRVVKKIKIAASSEKNRGSAPRVDVSNTGLMEKGIIRGLNPELEKMKCEDKRIEKPSGSTGDFRSEGKSIDDGLKNIASVKSSSGVAGSRHKLSPNIHVKAEKVKVESSVCNGILSRTDEPTKSFQLANLIAESSMKKDGSTDDGLKKPDDECNDLLNIKGGSSSIEVEPRRLEHAIGDFGSASLVLPSSPLLESTNASSKGPLEAKNKEEIISDFGQANGNPKMQIPLVTDGLEAQNLSLEHVQRPEGRSSIDLQSREVPNDLAHDACDLQDYESEHMGQHVYEKNPGMVSGPLDSKKLGPEQELEGRQEKILELKHAQSSTIELAKSGPMSSDVLASGGQKLVVAIGKPSTPNTQDISKLPSSDSYKSPGTTSSSTAARTVPFTKRVKVNSNTISKKVTVASGMSTEGNFLVGSSRLLKGSATSGDKSSQENKTIHTLVSKHKSVDSKENMPCPSKTSSTENSASSSGSGRLGGPPQIQSTLQVKLAPSDPGTKNARMTSPSSQTSNRVANHLTAMHPPAPPSFVNNSTTMSDEELAKRLHHELNSSPRVSRVPRGLHSSGIQFASSTSTSMLSKRASSSSSAGKVHVLHDSKASRRKNKDYTGKDAPHSREAADKIEKLEHLSFSSHKKQSESFHMNDSVKKDAHNGSHNILPSAKESSQLTFIAVDGSGPAFHTLPGLIDEIMNEGRHITYEELCDTVLPHWPSLRKPNGEQYAYSSHSLAVLDCLRNRNEWAHLVDYEPKTYSSKKRSKSNISPSIEGSGNEKANSWSSMERDDRSEESRREHLPTKGKRLARKRRKLMLQGRAVHVTKGREIDDAASDDDLQSLSGESESQSFSSKDEIRGRGRHNNTSGISASSQDESD